MALVNAIRQVQEIGLSSVTFLSDTQILFNSIEGSGEGTSEFNTLVSSIRSILGLNCNFKVKFV